MADERWIDAGEIALGLDPRAALSPADRAMVEDWDARLAPLLAMTPEAAPSDDLRHRIEAAIADEDAFERHRLRNEGANVVDLAAARAATLRWKGAAALFGAVAAALAIYVAVPQPEPAAERYVAVVTADDGSGAGLIIQIDAATGAATVVPVTAPPAGSSYEMWTIPEGQTRPVSLGLLPTEAVARGDLGVTPGQIFAISLEPEGGSPNGQPTTPLFHGTAVRVD